MSTVVYTFFLSSLESGVHLQWNTGSSAGHLVTWLVTNKSGQVHRSIETNSFQLNFRSPSLLNCPRWVQDSLRLLKTKQISNTKKRQKTTSTETNIGAQRRPERERCREFKSSNAFAHHLVHARTMDRLRKAGHQKCSKMFFFQILAARSDSENAAKEVGADFLFASLHRVTAGRVSVPCCALFMNLYPRIIMRVLCGAEKTRPEPHRATLRRR